MFYVIPMKRLLGIAAALVAVAVCFGLWASAAPTAATASAGNWGLSFPQQGQPPVANATAEALAPYNAYYVGDTSQKVIYLTFDAGYENGNTAPILDALKKHGVPATFFVVGHYLETAPDLVRRMVAEGHTVGNHTYHHPDMSAIATTADFAAELSAVEQKYAEVTGGEMPKIYRPPQGKYSVDNLKMAAELGYRTYFWSLAYVDWYTDRQPTPDEAYAKLLGRIHNGAVVLLHSTSSTNAAIMDDLIEKWKDMGYTFGTLDDIAGA